MRIDDQPFSLQLDKIDFRYTEEEPALKIEHVKLLSGKLVGLIGPNGSGKSTFVRLIAGLLPINSGGSIQISSSPAPKKYGLVARKLTGYIGQHTPLDREMTGGEHIELFSALYGFSKKQGKALAEKWVPLFNLNSHIKKTVRHYSGGLKQRLHLLIGFLNPAPIILLDEPTVGLDQQGLELFWSIIKEMNSEKRMILTVTHDLSFVEEHCKQILFFHQNKIKHQTTPQELVSNYADTRVVFEIETKKYDNIDWNSLGKQHPLITTIKRDGKQLHVNYISETDAINHIWSFFTQNGIHPLQVKPLRKDLVNAYFSVTRSVPKNLDDVNIGETGSTHIPKRKPGSGGGRGDGSGGGGGRNRF